MIFEKKTIPGRESEGIRTFYTMNEFELSKLIDVTLYVAKDWEVDRFSVEKQKEIVMNKLEELLKRNPYILNLPMKYDEENGISFLE